MTVRPAFESRPEPAGDAVVHAVAAARRRLRTVNALRLVAIATPGGVAAGAALALAGWAPAWAPAALGVLAAAGALAWAAADTPPPATVARVLDAHLEFKDRVTAALQLRQSGSPIAALVARDAVARLAFVDLTALFPLMFGRAHAASATVAVMMVGWLAATGVDGRRPAAPAASTEVNASASGEAGARAAGASRPSAADPKPQAPGQRSTTVTSEPRRPGTGVTDASRDASAGTSARTLQAAQPPAASAPARPVGPGDQPPAAAPGAPDASGREGRGGSAAAGSTSRGGLTTGAGGVAPGSALADMAGAGTSRPASVAAIGAARTNAEAALARDVIPPDHREHVREYFRALPAAGAGAGGSR